MNLLVTGAWKEYSKHLDKIKENGFIVFYHENESDKVDFPIEKIDYVICNNLFLSNEIKDFKNLKGIYVTSSGVDRLPMDYITQKGIDLNNARGVYSIPISEYVILGILYFYKHVRFFLENKKEKKWHKNRNLIELEGKKILIFGCGSVGIECAKKLYAFNCDVTGVDFNKNKTSYFRKIINPSELKSQVINEADVVISCLPLTMETKNIFNKTFFDQMKNDSVFVNVSRGGLVNEEDLAKSLKTKFLGAVLDVFNVEPLTSRSPLWLCDNIFITPHNSFVGDKNNERLSNSVLNVLKKWSSI